MRWEGIHVCILRTPGEDNRMGWKHIQRYYRRKLFRTDRIKNGLDIWWHVDGGYSDLKTGKH